MKRYERFCAMVTVGPGYLWGECDCEYKSSLPSTVFYRWKDQFEDNKHVDIMKMKQNTEAFGQNSRKLRVIYIDESNFFLSWNAILEIKPADANIVASHKSCKANRMIHRYCEISFEAARWNRHSFSRFLRGETTSIAFDLATPSVRLKIGQNYLPKVCSWRNSLGINGWCRRRACRIPQKGYDLILRNAIWRRLWTQLWPQSGYV